MNLTGWASDRVLYIGDHVYMDLAVSAAAAAAVFNFLSVYMPYLMPAGKCGQ